MALYRAAKEAGVQAFISDHYAPCDVLVLYGLGGSDRLAAATRHRKLGKHFVAWDLAYWDRNASPRKFRLSINGFHPSGVMAGYSDVGRFALTCTDVHDPSGPVMLVGNSPKSNAVGAGGWAMAKSQELAGTLPGKRIIYRPKPGKPAERGVMCSEMSTGPIADALQGMSLVVCRHSNVAVDACMAGVPVVCEGGAAAEIYPSTIENAHRQPCYLVRREFLNRLAWWQWSADESVQAWKFIEGKLCESMSAAGPGSWKDGPIAI